MKTSTIAWTVLIIIVLAGGAWYWYANYGANAAPYTTGTPTDQTSGTGQTGSPTTVLQSTTSTTTGPYLTAASSGMTLYVYANDTPGVSNCTGQCAANWSAYTVAPGAQLVATSGVNGQLGTLIRADGSMQLTYNGAPLYTYNGDSKPGDIKGQGVGNFSVAKP